MNIYAKFKFFSLGMGYTEKYLKCEVKINEKNLKEKTMEISSKNPRKFQGKNKENFKEKTKKI